MACLEIGNVGDFSGQLSVLVLISYSFLCRSSLALRVKMADAERFVVSKNVTSCQNCLDLKNLKISEKQVGMCGNLIVKMQSPVEISKYSKNSNNRNKNNVSHQEHNEERVDSTIPKNGGNLKFIVKYLRKKWRNSLSERQVVTIAILGCIQFLASAVISIKAPFYPEVARDKGSNASEGGLVLGSAFLTVFIVSPILGSKMDLLQPKRVYICGAITNAICCVIFGLLDDAIDDRTTFILSSLCIRIVEGIGDAAFDTAAFTIIAMEFPNSVATSFAFLEINYGLGLVIGPSLGGVLYQIGGYRLPFLITGGMLFASSFLAYLMLPEPSQKIQRNSMGAFNVNAISAPAAPIAGELSKNESFLSSDTHTSFEMFKILKFPVVTMTAYSIVAATSAEGFISANVEYHLNQFQLSKVALGVVFVLNGGVYAMTAPVWGLICDRINNLKIITLLGTIFIIVGFVLIGPIPYFPYNTTLFVSCCGMALVGLGLAATLVSSFLQMFQLVIEHGYPNDISTHGLVSGLWTSMSALGYFIGPAFGGLCVDTYGFRWASVFVIGGQIILVIMLAGIYFFKRTKDLPTWTKPTVM